MDETQCVFCVCVCKEGGLCLKVRGQLVELTLFYLPLGSED